jgi:signal peptidase I
MRWGSAPMAVKKNIASEVYEFIAPLVYAFVFGVLIFAFIAGRFSVNETSMTNTLHHGETVAVSRLPFAPKHGDIILFVKHGWANSYNEKTGQYNSLIKRVIGVSGDRIEFSDGKLFINGEEQNETYIRDDVWGWRDMEASLTVPDGSVFVMGDNRNSSSDSRMRSIGFVDERSILGKVLFRITPFDKFGKIG